MGYLASRTPDYLAWHKWHMGWLSGSQLRCLDTAGRMKVTLSPVETAGGTKLAIVKVGSTSAIAVEVRARQGGRQRRVPDRRADLSRDVERERGGTDPRQARECR